MPQARPFRKHPLTEAEQQALASISWDMPGLDVERESFRRIEEECRVTMSSLSPECWRIARRLIHTTADTSIASHLAFRNDAVRAGVRALRGGARILSDSRMIRAGLSIAKLTSCHPSYAKDNIACHIADPDVAEAARQSGRTRALCAMEKARSLNEIDGSIVLVGNAPLALAEVCRLVLEGEVSPALVIGMPVGFVNVIESKALLALCPVPHIVLEGRRGGSPLAVATLHALVELVLEGATP